MPTLTPRRATATAVAARRMLMALVPLVLLVQLVPAMAQVAQVAQTAPVAQTQMAPLVVGGGAGRETQTTKVRS